jgi:sirohydrochlorin ferrochelatase
VSAPALALVAHGSGDARAAQTIVAIAQRCRQLRPEVDVRVGFLDHGPPDVAAATRGSVVVVPLLLAAGYHVRTDIPAQAPNAVITEPVGPDRRLVTALRDRLSDAGWDGNGDVVLAAAGSRDPAAVDDVHRMAGWLSAALGAPVAAAFASSAEPRLTDLAPETVASYLLAPGVFADAIAACGARTVAAPIGDHPAVAQIVLDRYDRAGHVPGRTAPA